MSMPVRISTKLLGVNTNQKTNKSMKYGYLTGIMYLSPYKLSGVNLCPFAELAGCWKGCLNTAGHGGIGSTTISLNGIEVPDNNVQTARLARTEFFNHFRKDFMAQLTEEISKLRTRAEKLRLIPVVRLNGTSDILWEKQHITDDPRSCTIFEVFPDIQFYDYTKIAKRLERQLPTNYHLVLSYSEANQKYANACTKAWLAGASVVHVVRDEAVKEQYLSGQRFPNTPIVDGDIHDLRFLDPKNSVVVLKAKGRAKTETNGFVLD